MQMSADVQHSFADRFPKTVYVYPWQKIPLLIQYVATLLCEMWLRYSEYFTFPQDRAPARRAREAVDAESFVAVQQSIHI